MAGIAFGKRKAQAATEYLVLMSVVLMIALICIAILVWPTGSSKDVKTSQSDIKCGIAKNAVPDIMQGLAAYYRFDEGSGTLTYDRKSGASGTLNSTVTWAIGKSGSAPSFDGSSSAIELSSISGLSNAGTISLWFKASSVSGTSYPLSCGIAQPAFQISWDSINIWWNNAAGMAGGEHSGSYSVSTGTWYHFAFVYDINAGTYSLYRNGALIESDSGVTFQNYPSSCKVGMLSYADSGYYNGIVDDLHVYSRALSSDELKYLYEYPGCP